MRTNTEADFWERVDKFGPLPASCPERGNCWIWKGATDQDGYGIFKMAGVQWRCGRWRWHSQRTNRRRNCSPARFAKILRAFGLRTWKQSRRRNPRCAAIRYRARTREKLTARTTTCFLNRTSMGNVFAKSAGGLIGRSGNARAETAHRESVKAKITYSSPFNYKYAFARCEDGTEVMVGRGSLLGCDLPLPVGTPIDILKLREGAPLPRAYGVTLDRPLYP